MASPDRLRRPDASTRNLLGRATDRLERSISAGVAAAGHPMRPAHGAVFTNIDSEGTRLTQLAERALMTPQAMAELVDDLASLGYVRREPDPTDGRAKLIVLTDLGFEAVQTAFDTITRLEAQLEAELGPRALVQLRGVLQRVIDLPEA